MAKWNVTKISNSLAPAPVRPQPRHQESRRRHKDDEQSESEERDHHETDESGGDRVTLHERSESRVKDQSTSTSAQVQSSQQRKIDVRI